MMDAMVHLRLFVHQRLLSAAEEILGEVEKTLKLAFRHDCPSVNEEEKTPRTGAELQMSRTSVEHKDTQILNENQGPSAPDDSIFSLNPEVKGPSKSTPDVDSNSGDHCMVDFKMSEVKHEQEDLGNGCQTREVVFPSSEIVDSEQESANTNLTYEMHLSSSNCCAPQNEDSYTDEVLASSTVECAPTIKKEENMLQQQNGSSNENGQAVSSESVAAKERTNRSFCPLCGKSFYYTGPLQKHIKTHRKQKQCGFCGMTWRNTGSLLTHLKQFHCEECFCSICGNIFSSIDTLMLHKKEHTATKEFVCQECGKTFRHKYSLVLHVRIHSGEKPYHCDACGQSFHLRERLTAHQRKHSGEKPYHCGVCDNFFSTYSNLKKHIALHTGEKPYSCEICGKRFGQKGQLKIHSITHTEERRYACHLCGKTYKYASGLKDHSKTHGQ
ncbi:uncharacterized protein KZ484_004372 [Pholidichthys leucotaenia]